jgi:hypothetical protein
MSQSNYSHYCSQFRQTLPSFYSSSDPQPFSSSRPPPPNPPVLRCSRRLAALHHDNTTALLSSFSPFSESHDLLPLSIPDSSLSIDYVLSAIADGFMKPAVDTGDDPS